MIFKILGSALSGLLLMTSSQQVKHNDPLPALGYASLGGLVLYWTWQPDYQQVDAMPTIELSEADIDCLTVALSRDLSFLITMAVQCQSPEYRTPLVKHVDRVQCLIERLHQAKEAP